MAKKKFKTGKVLNASCPVCGEFMEMEEFGIEAGMVHIWYCKNSDHDFTAPHGLFEKKKKGGKKP
jgi:hypothetical protein